MDTKIIAVGLVAVLLIVGGIGGYINAQNEIKSAASATFSTVKITNYRFENLVLLPPSVTAVGIYTINNPSNYDLEINIDFDLYAGTYYVSELKVDETIRAKDTKTFEIKIPLTTEIIQNTKDIKTLLVDGEYSVKGKWLFYSVDYVRSFSKE